MNIRLTIEYDGADFVGWQIQDEGLTIQGEIQRAIEKVVGKRIVLRGAGRTDSGVHAVGQVANFHSDRLPAKEWRQTLNALLPPTIRIVEADEVSENFDSQRDAKSKIYHYRILNRRYASALDRRVYFYAGPIDWERVRDCLPAFEGEHDFRCFQGAGASVKTTVRTVHRFELIQSDKTPGLYVFEVEGNGFLKQMVRAMVGTAIEVGEGRRSKDEVEAIIASKDRTQAGRTAPASGLCLMTVKY